MLKQGRTL